MPNWCENILIIEGDGKQLIKFVKLAKTPKSYYDKKNPQYMDFNQFVPFTKEDEHKEKIKNLARDLKNSSAPDKDEYIKNLPEETKREIMLINLEDKEESDWMVLYGWHTINWGTKWNAYCYKKPSKVDNNTMIYPFDTAWSVPVPVVITMAKQFPNLSFTLLYGEPGNNFSGRLRFENGKMVLNQADPHYKNNWAYPGMFMRKHKLTKCKNVILNGTGNISVGK